MPPGEPHRFHKEMGADHREIRRIMPRVADGGPFRETERGYSVSFEGGTVEIIVGPEDRRILTGSLSLPLTRVQLVCHGMSREQAQRFERKWYLHFQKGGG